jgi:DNA-binding MarR family transcriptional regulator
MRLFSEELLKEKDFSYYEKILNLPPAAKFILYILDVKKLLTRTQIIRETLLPKRTVGASLTILIDEGFISKVCGKELQTLDCNYRKKIDYREVFYKLNEDL